MQTILSCPACGKNCSEKIVALNAQNLARFIEFSKRKYSGLLSEWIYSAPPEVIRCLICSHYWYLHQPEPEQLTLMYAKGRSFRGNTTLSREPTAHMLKEMLRLRKLLGTSKKGKTLLDFGSGLGRWSRAAVREGFTVTAYEPSVERGFENNLPFEYVHSIEQLKSRKFDAIQIEQVLEHVPNPLETMKHLREVCTPETVIRVTVPNFLRFQAVGDIWSRWPYDGRRVHEMAPFEHLHGFTPNSLDKLLTRAGYKNISVIIEAKHARTNMLRKLIGAIFPKINSTLRFVQTKI